MYLFQNYEFQVFIPLLTFASILLLKRKDISSTVMVICMAATRRHYPGGHVPEINNTYSTYRYVQIRTDTYGYVRIRTDTYGYVRIRTNTYDTYGYVQIRTNTYRYGQIRIDTCRYIQIRAIRTIRTIYNIVFLRLFCTERLTLIGFSSGAQARNTVLNRFDTPKYAPSPKRQ